METLRRLTRGIPMLTLLMSLAAMILWRVPHGSAHLEYDRAAIRAGEWWRLFTTHGTHWSANHLLWDVGVFALLGAICERRNCGAFIRCIAVSATLISASVWIFLPHMQTYRGLSGIDSALFALLAADLLRRHLAPGGRRELAVAIVVLLALFVAKIGIELISAKAVFVNSEAAGMVPVPLAHIAGALVGLLGSAFGAFGGDQSASPAVTAAPLISPAVYNR